MPRINERYRSKAGWRTALPFPSWRRCDGPRSRLRRTVRYQSRAKCEGRHEARAHVSAIVPKDRRSSAACFSNRSTKCAPGERGEQRPKCGERHQPRRPLEKGAFQVNGGHPHDSVYAATRGTRLGSSFIDDRIHIPCQHSTIQHRHQWLACIVSIARCSVSVLAVRVSYLIALRISSLCAAALCANSTDLPNAHAAYFP